MRPPAPGRVVTAWDVTTPHAGGGGSMCCGGAPGAGAVGRVGSVIQKPTHSPLQLSSPAPRDPPKGSGNLCPHHSSPWGHSRGHSSFRHNDDGAAACLWWVVGEDSSIQTGKVIRLKGCRGTSVCVANERSRLLRLRAGRPDDLEKGGCGDSDSQRLPG